MILLAQLSFYLVGAGKRSSFGLKYMFCAPQPEIWNLSEDLIEKQPMTHVNKSVCRTGYNFSWQLDCLLLKSNIQRKFTLSAVKVKTAFQSQTLHIYHFRRWGSNVWGQEKINVFAWSRRRSVEPVVEQSSFHLWLVIFAVLRCPFVSFTALIKVALFPLLIKSSISFTINQWIERLAS